MKKRKNYILEQLRKNRINGKLDVTYDKIYDKTFETLNESKDILIIIDKQIRENDRSNVRLGYYAGRIIQFQKQNLIAEDFKNFKKSISYSNSWDNVFNEII